MKKYSSIISNGLIAENPVFRLVLGMCPTMAISTSVQNGIAMGLAATFVLICSNFVISLLRNFVPEKVRIPAFIVVIATFVTVVQLVMEAFLPDLSKALGLYIPLIVVNCIIFARAESYASKNPPLASIIDGVGMGIGFTLALAILSCVREVLGAGTLLGIPLFGEAFKPALIFVLAPGGFITLGILMGAFNLVIQKIEQRQKARRVATEVKEVAA